MPARLPEGREKYSSDRVGVDWKDSEYVFIRSYPKIQVSFPLARNDWFKLETRLRAFFFIQRLEHSELINERLSPDVTAT